jgi:hypothetical protein
VYIICHLLCIRKIPEASITVSFVPKYKQRKGALNQTLPHKLPVTQNSSDFCCFVSGAFRILSHVLYGYLRLSEDTCKEIAQNVRTIALPLTRTGHRERDACHVEQSRHSCARACSHTRICSDIALHVLGDFLHTF